MNNRAISLAVACVSGLAMLVAGVASAQQADRTVAKLKDLKGNVLVSSGDALVAGKVDQRLPAGTRVLTTAGASVTIDYDIGCDIRLKENERFTVRLGTDCAALLATVESLGPAAGAIGGGAAGATVAGSSGANIAVGVAAAGGLAYGLYQTSRNKSESPPPVIPPIEPPVKPPVEPPIEPPVKPPIEPPVKPPIEPPIQPPIEPPVSPN